LIKQLPEARTPLFTLIMPTTHCKRDCQPEHYMLLWTEGGY
jgi:hypothetical protein